MLLRSAFFSGLMLLAAAGSNAQTTTDAQPAKKEYHSDAPELVRNEFALPWAGIAVHDIEWKKRIWRDFDFRTMGTAQIPYTVGKASGSDLAKVIMDGAATGAIKAYSPVDDRFTTELTREQVQDLAANKNGIFDPAHTEKFRVKGDWFYIGCYNMMVFRIVGIAPLKEVKGADGTTKDEAAFWIYFRESREYLAGHKVLNGKKYEQANWDQYLIAMQHS